MKEKISRKITFFVILILLVVISSMVLFSYNLFKNFYKEMLADEAHEQLRAYSAMIEEGIEEEMVAYLILEKNHERHVNMIYFDENLELVYSSHSISERWLKEYQDWVQERYQSGGETLQYIDTGIDFHIPHIWAYNPIYKKGEFKGFFFIDQDTGEFEKAKIQLFLLLFAMGVVTLLIGMLLTVYLTKIISKPLIQIGESTRKIAKGDFDIQLPITSKDEVGQLAANIHDMTKQLKEYRDSKQQFISHISHDLRTPITYVKGYSAVMRDASTIDEEEWRGYINVIYQEAKRMEYLVSDLFQLTKLEEGKIVLEKERIELLPWLKSIVATRQLMLEDHLLTCEVVGEDAPVFIEIDQQCFGQAIINIIENSIRYTPRQGKIALIVTTDFDHVCIEIQDSGIGIAKEDLPHIWERFYRVDKARSRESGGSGLGLAIVKEIVHAHGGSVSVESEIGKGTSFFLHLKKG